MARRMPRCRLPLERLAQLTVPSLKLLEEAHVLDRDDRLGGEGPQELDLALREGALRAGHVEGAEGATIPEHRDDDQAAEPLGLRELAKPGWNTGIMRDVRAVDHGGVANRAGPKVPSSRPVGNR